MMLWILLGVLLYALGHCVHERIVKEKEQEKFEDDFYG